MTNFLEILGSLSGDSKSSPEKNPEKKGENPEGDSNFLLSILNKLSGKDKENATKIVEAAKEERSDVLINALTDFLSGSVLNRYYPEMGKAFDLGKLIRHGKALDLNPQKVMEKLSNLSLANLAQLPEAIDEISALSMFIPDSMLKSYTDVIVKSSWFMPVLKNWQQFATVELRSKSEPETEENWFSKQFLPERQNWVEKITKDNYDPDDVISILRIMSKDLQTILKLVPDIKKLIS